MWTQCSQNLSRPLIRRSKTAGLVSFRLDICIVLTNHGLRRPSNESCSYNGRYRSWSVADCTSILLHQSRLLPFAHESMYYPPRTRPVRSTLTSPSSSIISRVHCVQASRFSSPACSQTITNSRSTINIGSDSQTSWATRQ